MKALPCTSCPKKKEQTLPQIGVIKTETSATLPNASRAVTEQKKRITTCRSVNAVISAERFAVSLLYIPTYFRESLKNFCARNRLLFHHQQHPMLTKTNWVVNLSSRSLNEAEVSLLKEGLNFAVTPADIRHQRSSPRLNQQSDNWMRNEQTQCGELLTPSFNRLSHRSLTSRIEGTAVRP